MNAENPLLLQFLANRSSNDSSLINAVGKKNANSTIVNNNAEQEISVKIDKSFIPDSVNLFHLDAKKMSYVMNPKDPDELRKIIEEEANKKLNNQSTVRSAQSNSENSGSSNSNQNSSSFTDSYNDSVNSSVENKNGENRERKSEDYYQVNLSQIKFLIYDYKKEALIESSEKIKMSQVEFKKSEDYNKKEELIVKELVVSKKEVLETNEDDPNDSTNKEAVLIKQIEYALSKEENQPTITRMRWISFFIFVAFITLSTLFLSMFISSVSLISENIGLVYDSYDLISNTIYSVYHTRELILLNNPKYTNFYMQREDYIMNNTNALLDIFTGSHDLITNIITTNMPITDANFAILSNSTIQIYILEENLEVKQVDLTLSASFLETNTALYHIANQQISNIYPTSKDVFFYLYNSFNSIYDKLFLHARIFIEELTSNINSFKYNFLIIFSTACGFSFFAYFLISYAYLAVGRRKESYLEVFFEIGEGVIRNSLEKCEKFSKKFQSDSISGDDLSSYSERDMHSDPVLLTLGTGKSNRSSHNRKRKSNNSREDRIIKLKIFFGLLLISLFFFIIYIIYQKYLETIKTYVMVYDNVCSEQAYFLLIFNTLREYFFDKTSYIFNTRSKDFIQTSLDDIYIFKRDRENVLQIIFFIK